MKSIRTYPLSISFIIRVLLFFFLYTDKTVTAQVQNLFINSYDNIVKLNSTTSSPIISYTGIKNGFEAIAHAEDSVGNILFFVNSNGVYNSKGILMPGSADIYANSSASEINICPFPGNRNKYYIIYNSELCSPLYYSIVDMQLNKGLGDVINLNTLLDTSEIAEGLELVRIPCRNNFWLLAYACDAGFKRYLIDEDGISSDTVIYPYSGPSIFLGRGELDYHNGKMGFSFANTPVPVVFFSDFDAGTGAITNAQTIELPEGGNGVYGLEFSPDGSKAYMTEWYKNKTDNLFQYDFETGKLSSYYITSSAPDITQPASGPGQIELGADGKLYIPFDGGNQIAIINNPNSIVPVFSKITVNSRLALGISDHIQSDLLKPANNFTYKNVCLTETTQFEFKPSDCVGREPYILWDFGDPESKKNSSKKPSPSHYYSKAGKYKVILYVSDALGKDTISHIVTISAYPNVNLGNEVTICRGDTITLDAGNNGMNYSWSTGSYLRQIKVSTAGKYKINVSNKGCSKSDSIRVKFHPQPVVSLGPDLWLCDEPERMLNAGTNAKTYLWSTGENTSKIKVNATGTYSVIVSNGLCVVSDTIDLTFQNSPDVYLGNDLTLCRGKMAVLDAGNNADSYLWSTGEITPTIKVNKTGVYFVSANKGTCIASDTINITVLDDPLIIVPAGFTVNSKESVFKISTKNIRSYHIKIVNDSSKQIYESNDATSYWNGKTSHSKYADSGTYSYIIEYTTACDTTIKNKKGTFLFSTGGR